MGRGEGAYMVRGGATRRNDMVVPRGVIDRASGFSLNTAF
jgi:hypothetical protein